MPTERLLARDVLSLSAGLELALAALEDVANEDLYEDVDVNGEYETRRRRPYLSEDMRAVARAALSGVAGVLAEEERE